MDDEIQKPLITTVIPTYRRPKLLRRAINSVLNQTYPHFQVCVYDNASGDETADVVAELAQKDSRVKYHCHSENMGATKNFLYGMEHVETPFFSILSDDDILLPEFYKIAMKGFEKHLEAIFSATVTLITNEQGSIWNVSGFKWKPGFYQPPDGLLAMLKYGQPTWTGIIFRKEVIEKVGIMDQEVALQDLDYELRTAARCPFVVSKELGAIFTSKSKPLAVWEQIRFVYPSWSKMIRNLSEDEKISPAIRTYVEQVLTEQLKKIIFRIGLRAIRRKDFEETYRAIEILHNHYHLKKKAFLILTIAKICRYFPPAYYFSVLLHKSRKLFAYIRWRKRNQNLHESYKNILTIIGEYR